MAASKRWTAAALALALLGACGSDGGGGGGGGTGFTATIDGQAWASDTISERVTQSAASPGTFILQGTQVNGSTGTSVVLTLYNIGATGTFPLGVGPTVFGGSGSVTVGSNTWLTPLNGASGTVTVTTLSSSRIAGTFSFNASPLLGGAGTKAVTAGSFDLPLSTAPLTVPDDMGSTLTATIGGASFNAATVVTVAQSGGVYSFGGSTTGAAVDYFVDFILSTVTGPGTITLNTSTAIMLVQTSGQEWSSQIGGSGTVVITSLDSDRIQGTFSATLTGGVGSSPLTITGGTFNVGLQ